MQPRLVQPIVWIELEAPSFHGALIHKSLSSSFLSLLELRGYAGQVFLVD
jgi:hypothetical protein